MKKIAFTLLMASLVSVAQANTPDASASETAWFAGNWATGPADVPGFDTIGPAPDCSRAVTIRVVKGNVIVRETRLRNGSLHSAEFAVKHFGQNFPWWPTDGAPGPVAKRTGDDVFLLARTGNMGKADWDNALQHTRCKSADKP